MVLSLRAKVILTTLLLALAWFIGLGHRDLFQTDEGRYAEIPREMLVTGDWVTPRLDGLKYFEKPPLQYWATALSYELFGESNASSRLWTGLLGFLGILMTAFVGARLFGERSAWCAALTLVGSVYYAIMGHFNTLDMGVSFFMCGSLFAFLLAMQARDARAERGWMLLAWGFAALATLSKGLEAVALPGAVFLLYAAITRDWRRFTQLHFIAGLSLYLAVAAPWFILVSLRNPEFPRFFFIHEHFERFLTTVHHRVEPWWFFIPILLFGLFGFLPQFLRAFVRLFRHASYVTTPGRFNHTLFLWLWCGFIFVFFSLSDSKLGSYILPIFPALALLVGRELAEFRRRDALLSALLCLLLAAAALWQAPALQQHSDQMPLDLYHEFLPWLWVGAGVVFVTGLTGFVFAWRNRVGLALGLSGLGLFLGTQAIACGAETLSPAYSQRALADAIAPYDRPDLPFYSLQDYPQSLPFYLNRTFTLVAYKGELEFGIDREPRLWIPDLGAFASQWRADTSALAVMPPETYAELSKQGLPMTVIGRDPQHVAVRKP